MTNPCVFVSWCLGARDDKATGCQYAEPVGPVGRNTIKRYSYKLHITESSQYRKQRQYSYTQTACTVTYPTFIVHLSTIAAMPIAAIISITTSPNSPPPGQLIHLLTQALKPFSQSVTLSIGTKTQDPNTIQITSSWPSFDTTAALASSTDFLDFKKAIETSTDATSSLLTTLTTLKAHTSTATPFNLTTPPLMEWVKTSFPAQTATSEFKETIEKDFARFEDSFRDRVQGSVSPGEMGLATGWTEERDGDVGFVVARGWRGMQHFDAACQTEVFKRNIGILIGWGAKFELWHVEQRGSGGEA
jgi:hypothetical protein